MARLDLYRNVHKGQRAELFACAVQIGRLDSADTAARQALAARLRGVLDTLRQHALHEQTFIHPLLRKNAPVVAEALEKAHRSFDPLVAELDARLDALTAPAENPAEDGTALYHAWCRMIAVYLAHLDQEESEAMPALWAACSDDEILGVMRAFGATRKADDVATDLRHQVPALNPAERSAYVGAMTKGGAISANAALELLGNVMSREDLARLRLDLAA